MANIVQPSIVPSLAVANRLFSDVRNLKVLHAFLNAAGGGNATFREPGGTAGYTPSGTKSFRILALRLNAVGQAGNSNLTLLYTDNDLGVASATAAVGAKYPGDNSLLGIVASAPQQTTTAQLEVSANFVVPNTKFPSITSAGGALIGSITLFGYEE